MKATENFHVVPPTLADDGHRCEDDPSFVQTRRRGVRVIPSKITGSESAKFTRWGPNNIKAISAHGGVRTEPVIPHIRLDGSGKIRVGAQIFGAT
jgi:hypothetical protein